MGNFADVLSGAPRLCRLSGPIPLHAAFTDAVRMTVPRQFESLKHLVSNTPMLAIHARVAGVHRVVHAKAENFTWASLSASRQEQTSWAP